MSTAAISHSQGNRASAAGESGARWNVINIVTSFSLFLVGAFTIAEMFAFWVFRANGELIAFAFAAFVAAALTVVFRSHMQVTGSGKE